MIGGLPKSFSPLAISKSYEEPLKLQAMLSWTLTMLYIVGYKKYILIK